MRSTRRMRVSHRAIASTTMTSGSGTYSTSPAFCRASTAWGQLTPRDETLLEQSVSECRADSVDRRLASLAAPGGRPPPGALRSPGGGGSSADPRRTCVELRQVMFTKPFVPLSARRPVLHAGQDGLQQRLARAGGGAARRPVLQVQGGHHIRRGANDSDISFYFAHWLTDLAGTEPFGDGPWPGSEKFALKFPLKVRWRHVESPALGKSRSSESRQACRTYLVLNAFLDSFTYVHKLSFQSEVQGMEDYLCGRWGALGLPADASVGGCAVASMRVALMAQGFEHAAVAALQGLPPQDRDLLAAELARTGLRAQFVRAPADVAERPVGPALLVYYAPALIQTAGAAFVGEALKVLAAVCRASRELFPLEAALQAVESTVVIRIDALKALTPPEVAAGGPWLLQRMSAVEAIVVRMPDGAFDALPGTTAPIRLAESLMCPASTPDLVSMPSLSSSEACDL
ncbi:unnamed protein product [Prorocentrum cordatum]|uniref:Uncharacterized protein n=1 Tax=Prorocentrum cordatum TaxID=2364126 RepID=A0ABN9PJW9_9DINO|nr:unnamed protein product [Polarella glacialis]